MMMIMTMIVIIKKKKKKGKKKKKKNSVPNLTVNQVGDSWCPDSLPIEVKLVEVGGTLSEKVGNQALSLSLSLYFLLIIIIMKPKQK
jgi:hypothetical protein